MNNRRITPALTLAAALLLPAAPAASAAPGSTSGTAVTAATDARARELAAAIERSIAVERELFDRIRDLEEARSELERRIAATHASPAIAPGASAASAPAAAAAGAAPPRPAAPSPVPPPASTTPTESATPYLPGALTALALLLAGWLWVRRRRGATFTPAPAAGAASTPVAGSGARPAPESGAAPSVLDWSADDETPKPAAPRAGPNAEPNREEHKSAVELADIMMSFGRVHGAAETLAEFIRGNPRQAVTPWLKLLEVYRAAGLRIEFDTIAKELNKTFNVNVVTWQNYDELRASTTRIEDMPHIARALQESWRTPACQLYLQQLLRDNREGTRAGFPFTVIDEILLLAAILDDELGPCTAAPGTVAAGQA
ncbi:hypothetical protein [Thauera aromatica]|uniref:Uncharacterized protein n=1 Tax=Thauera aromatica K172 TaxID=44139 RepID=A0A2R4BJW0_THAAR|nr:hypothetical protein [Thauera aromatica]AVR87591.1 hypothetical protein Tharo_0649 [Thauera aromatica K172]